MANKQTQKQTETLEAKEAPVDSSVAAVETTEAANIVDGVWVEEIYNFGDEDHGALTQDEMAIGHLFRAGFDPTPYDFRWIRYNGMRDAERRYLIKVTKALHGKWFNEQAFHPVYGAIVCGERFMAGSTPEFYLMVRPKAALDAENAVASRRNASRVETVEEDSGFKAVTSQMAGVGGLNVSGGITKSPHPGWK